nr:hypothetical protein GCM10020241_21890 [Streptoalloteichus tenebrarius]
MADRPPRLASGDVRRSWIALLAAATGLGLLAGPAAADEPVPPSADRVVTDYQDPVQALPPVSRPPTRSCAVTAMRHTFANSYGRPYVGTLTPPPDCPGPWSKVVLDWTGRSRGRQYDRLAGLWIGGAEVLRTSTPEPDPSGITWHFDRDITPFAPLLREPQPLVVDLGNIVNDTYTGAYDIEVTITYYGVDERHPAPSQGRRRGPAERRPQAAGLAGGHRRPDARHPGRGAGEHRAADRRRLRARRRLRGVLVVQRPHRVGQGASGRGPVRRWDLP